MTAPTPVLTVPPQRVPGARRLGGWTPPPERLQNLPDRLDDLRSVLVDVERGQARLLAAVAAARGSGATWRQLGEVFGLTGKSVWKWYAVALRESPAGASAGAVVRPS